MAFAPVLEIFDLPSTGTFLGLCASLVLLWRFAHTTGAAVVIISLSALTPSAAPAVWSILFILGMRHPRLRSILALVAALSALGVQVTLYETMNVGSRRLGDLVVFVVLALVMLIGSGTTGYVVGLLQHRSLTTAKLLAAALDREEATISKTRASERLQLAGEIHDVLSHHLSKLILHTSALQHAPLTPQETRDSINIIARSARDAVEELHEVLEILEDARQGSTAETYADGLTEIFQELSEDGLRISPAMPPNIGEFTSVDQRTIERFFREALKNVLQHAATPSASISWRSTPLDSRWTVTSTIRGNSATASLLQRTPQFGILKLQQRARLRHGDVLTRVSATTFEIELVIARLASF